MRKIILYIAQSLDGFIAKPNGDVSWLEEIPNPEQSDYGYQAFFESIDTTLMGNNTYQQILGFDIPFPYKGKTNLVFTTNPILKDTEDVTFISENPIDKIRKLKMAQGKDIWLVGGGKLNTFFLDHDLIDCMRIFVMPMALGHGIPIFTGMKQSRLFQLEDQKRYSSGVVELIYGKESVEINSK